MKLLEAKKRIQQIQVPFLHTHEVAKILDLSNAQASLVLHRLEETQDVLSLKKGLWLFEQNVSSFLIGEHLVRALSARHNLADSRNRVSCYFGAITKKTCAKQLIPFITQKSRYFTTSHFAMDSILRTRKRLFLIFFIFLRQKQIFLNHFPSLSFLKNLRKRSCKNTVI